MLHCLAAIFPDRSKLGQGQERVVLGETF
jgi:hypothetical protein